MAFKIISYNISKRIFSVNNAYFLDLAPIILLQEPHSSYFSQLPPHFLIFGKQNGKKSSSAIIINKTFGLSYSFIDFDCPFISAILIPNIFHSPLLLVSIYVPHSIDERAIVESKCSQILRTFNLVLFGGDFNMTSKKTWVFWKSLTEKNLIIDVSNSDHTFYLPNYSSKLDYFFVTNSRSININKFKYEILNSFHSGHSPIQLYLEIDVFQPVLRKLNPKLKLHNKFTNSQQANFSFSLYQHFIKLKKPVTFYDFDNFFISFAKYSNVVARSLLNLKTFHSSKPYTSYFKNHLNTFEFNLKNGKSLPNYSPPFYPTHSQAITFFDSALQWEKEDIKNPCIPDYIKSYYNKERSPEPNNYYFSLKLNMEDLLSVLKDSDPSKSVCNMGINCYIISCWPTVALTSLLEFFNLVLENNIPKSWKSTTVTLIPKKSKDSLRPISSEITYLKILCKMVERKIRKFVEEEKILDNCQRGFRKGKSQTEIVWFSQIFLSQLNENSFLVQLDLKKAFDSLNHVLLIKILHFLHFPVAFILFVKDLLYNYNYSIKCDDFTSMPILRKKGVPQGNPLSPLLFIIYITPITKFLNNYIKLNFKNKLSTLFSFADDITILLQNVSLYNFSEFWKLIINVFSDFQLPINFHKTLIFNKYISQIPSHLSFHKLFTSDLTKINILGWKGSFFDINNFYSFIKKETHQMLYTYYTFSNSIFLINLFLQRSLLPLILYYSNLLISSDISTNKIEWIIQRALSFHFNIEHINSSTLYRSKNNFGLNLFKFSNICYKLLCNNFIRILTDDSLLDYIPIFLEYFLSKGSSFFNNLNILQPNTEIPTTSSSHFLPNLFLGNINSNLNFVKINENIFYATCPLNMIPSLPINSAISDGSFFYKTKVAGASSIIVHNNFVHILCAKIPPINSFYSELSGVVLSCILSQILKLTPNLLYTDSTSVLEVLSNYSFYPFMVEINFLRKYTTKFKLNYVKSHSIHWEHNSVDLIAKHIACSSVPIFSFHSIPNFTYNFPIIRSIFSPLAILNSKIPKSLFPKFKPIPDKSYSLWNTSFFSNSLFKWVNGLTYIVGYSQPSRLTPHLCALCRNTHRLDVYNCLIHCPFFGHFFNKFCQLWRDFPFYLPYSPFFIRGILPSNFNYIINFYHNTNAWTNTIDETISFLKLYKPLDAQIDRSSNKRNCTSVYYRPNKIPRFL